MTYDEILPLVRRAPFVPLRVVLNDGRTYDLRRFGQFAMPPYEMIVRLPYDLPTRPGRTERIRISYADIKEVFEIPAAELLLHGEMANGSA